MKITLQISPKYQGARLNEFLGSVKQAVTRYRVPTESERNTRLIDYSMSNDFRNGFRRREHGQDAMTIAGDRREWVSTRIPLERKQQELEFLRELAAATEEFQRHIEEQIRNLSGELGTGGYGRIREIEQARKNLEAKHAEK